MIPFFRKLRYGLLAGNKVTKYLLYAIGEIVLVVIGILIALAINNSNQRSITQEKEQVYLQGLKSEFEASRIKLENLIAVNKKSYEHAKEILLLLDGEPQPPDETKLASLIFQSFANEIAYNPNNSLLNEMISSGSLKDISNAKLRRALSAWETFTESIKVHEANLRYQRESVQYLLRSNEGNIRSILDQAAISSTVLDLPVQENPPSNLALLQSQTFENNVLLFILTSMSTETEHYRPLLTEITVILHLIDTELNP